MPKTPEHCVSESPELMLEWDFETNSGMALYPEHLGTGSTKVAWWICPNGHNYDMRIKQRTRGQGCPYCSGRRVLAGFNDLSTTNPELMQSWDYEKNELAPQEVSRGSSEIVWWKCSAGHTYQRSIKKKTSRRAGCPVCSGHLTISGVNDFETFYPDIAKEWHPSKNGEPLPSTISKKGGRKVWWICAYGHEWQATPHDRATDGTGCPICSQRRQTSFPEQAILFYVRKLYPDTVSRYKDLFENGMELDIYIPSIRLAIEFDGAFWHNDEEAHRREKQKYEICRQYGITLFRVKEQTGHAWNDVSDATYFLCRRRNPKELQQIIQAIVDSIDRESNMWTRRDPLRIRSSIVINLERDANEIREYLTPIPNSLSILRPDLVKEWNREQNGNLRPEMFGINSNDKVWWTCSACGHEWQTAIIHRAGKRSSGCSECAKKNKGETFTRRKVSKRGSLAENNPILAAEWHPTKNGNLTPQDITEKRFASVWWLCPKCGHEWEASPNNRSKGVGCPCCSGRVPKIGVNDFKTLHPEIAQEWNYARNTDLLPEQFLPGSGKKVWWTCRICGYEWESVINNRTKGHGCPKYRSHYRLVPKSGESPTKYSCQASALTCHATEHSTHTHVE